MNTKESAKRIEKAISKSIKPTLKMVKNAEQKEIKKSVLAYERRAKRASRSFFNFEQYYTYCMSFPTFKRKGNKS